MASEELFRHRANLGSDLPPVLGVPQQALDPRLRAVVGLDLVLHEQPAENDADADVRERAEREELLRRGDELVQPGSSASISLTIAAIGSSTSGSQRFSCVVTGGS